MTWRVRTFHINLSFDANSFLRSAFGILRAFLEAHASLDVTVGFVHIFGSHERSFRSRTNQSRVHTLRFKRNQMDGFKVVFNLLLL